MNTVQDLDIPSLESLRWELYYDLADRHDAMSHKRFHWIEERISEIQRAEFRDAFVASYVQAFLTPGRIH